MASTHGQGAVWRASAQRLPWLLMLIAAGVVLWPALRPVHIEGFSAAIAALGLHLRQGAVQDFFPSAPFNDDYFGLNKLGAVYGVAALSPLFGGTGAFTVETLLGAVLTLGASAYLIRRWSGTSWLVAGAALLLMPGAAESFYVFSDNALAAGLLLLALALWSRWPSWPMAVLTGVLIGYAVTTRIDTLLCAVAAMPLIALEQKTLRQSVVPIALAGAVALAVLWGAFALVRSTPLDAVRAGETAVLLWGWSRDALQDATTAVLYLSLPTLALLAFGLVRLVTERRWRRLALCLGAPLFVSLALLGRMREVRQLLPLTPFLGALVAVGVQTLVDDWRRGQRVGPAAIAALVLAWTAAPMRGLVIADGPHVLVGRIAGLRLWWAWQRTVRADFRRIDAVVDAAPAGATTAVVTEGWNEDRYLHLLLVEHGFRRAPAPAACERVGEAMAAGGRTIVEVSIRQTFLGNFWGLNAPRLERYGEPCLKALRPARTIFLGATARMAFLFDSKAPPAGPKLPDGRLLTSEIVARPLDAEGLALLDRAWRREAAAWGPAQDVERAIDLTGSRTPFSR